MNHRTPSKDVADAGTFRSACVVHALGFHRVGELLRCDRTSNSYVDLPFDHPCIHDRLTSEIASGEATTSTLGQNRGSYVAIQNGIGWKAVQVPSRDWFQINDAGVVFDYLRLPGYGPDKPVLVLP